MQEVWLKESWWADQFRYLQGFELALPHIYPICELLECVKELVLQFQSFEIS